MGKQSKALGILFGVAGGGAINGESGARILKDLTEIVNAINGNQSTLPKVKLQFDTSQAKTAIEQLKTEIKKLEEMGKITVTTKDGSSGSKGGKKSGDDTSATKQQNQNYKQLTATIKEYYAELAKVQKIQMKSDAVSSNNGQWATTDAQYDNRIAKINNLKATLENLGLAVTQESQVQLNAAQSLNISDEQRLLLQKEIQSATMANRVANEDSTSKISATWTKNSAKARSYIVDLQNMGVRNKQVNDLMRELNQILATNDPRQLDKLTAKMGELQGRVRETGADVQTFGQKLAKTFGSQLRYMLTSMVYMKALQFIRELYSSVVELDKAMTDLQIASGKTRDEVRELTTSYAALGRELGATTTEVAKSADTWLRQGYSIEETNTLIANSMMLSKLGQIESEEAAKNLTSAMKGYKVSVEDSINIVDKFTAVDMEAAASAGDIATAMAETATGAGIAGVSMDRLIGYIATVKEVTQDGAESVGKQNCLTIQ